MTTTVATKTCATCGLDKPLSEFGKRPNGNGGVYPRAHCRDCMNAAQRADNARKARRAARERARRAEARAEIVIDDYRDKVPDFILREEWRHFRACGLSNEQIAQRLGYAQVDYMLKALRNAGINPDEPPTSEPLAAMLALARVALWGTETPEVAA